MHLGHGFSRQATVVRMCSHGDQRRKTICPDEFFHDVFSLSSLGPMLRAILCLVLRQPRLAPAMTPKAQLSTKYFLMSGDKIAKTFQVWWVWGAKLPKLEKFGLFGIKNFPKSKSLESFGSQVGNFVSGIAATAWTQLFYGILFCQWECTVMTDESCGGGCARTRPVVLWANACFLFAGMKPGDCVFWWWSEHASCESLSG